MNEAQKIMMAPAVAAAKAQADTVEVTDINQFVQITADWHARKVAVLKHMLTVPQDALTLEIDGKDVALKGELHQGYLLGIQYALSEMGTLPFMAELEDVPTTDLESDASQ